MSGTITDGQFYSIKAAKVEAGPLISDRMKATNFLSSFDISETFLLSVFSKYYAQHQGYSLFCITWLDNLECSFEIKMPACPVSIEVDIIDKYRGTSLDFAKSDQY